MYSPQIAIELRHRGHDVVAVVERPELVGRSDEELLVLMAKEGRAIVTNNVADFVPLVQAAATSGTRHGGVLFTSDRSLPRSRAGIGRYVAVLQTLLVAHPTDDAFASETRWLP